MTDFNRPISLANKKYVIEYIKIIINDFFDVIRSFFSCVKKIFFKFKDFLTVKINNFYYYITPRLDHIKLIIKKSLFITDLLILLAYFIYYLVKNYYYNDYIYNQKITNYIIYTFIAEIVIYLGFIAFLNFYNTFFGKEANLLIDREFTSEYIQKYLPKIAKIYGFTGSGKDELASGISTMQVEGFKNSINEEMIEIKNICYVFDFEKLENEINKNADLFYTSNEKKSKANFLEMCKENDFFIKNYYRTNIIIDSIIADSVKFKNNKLTYISKMVYTKGGISNEHFLNMLYKYTMLYIRIIEKHFLFTNQPFIEDMELSEGASIFNLNYLITKKQPNIKFTEKNEYNENILKEYSEKVLFPFKDYHGFLETEVGTWYINLDKQVNAMLQQMGIRDFKAYNRHFMPHFFWYQVDQDASRTSKLFRELDHAYIRIDSREVIDCTTLYNNKLLKKADRLERKINNITNKYYSTITNNSKVNDKIIKANKLALASANDISLIDKIFNLKASKKYYNVNKHIKKYEIKLHDFLNQIKLNEYLHGYVVKTITICHEPILSSFDLKKPSEILNNPDYTRGNYSIKLTFKKSDVWRYDTHYMKMVKNTRAEASELSLNEVPTWNQDLIMNKNNIKDMGYIQASELFDIPMKEMLLNHYKETNNEKE